MQTSKTQQRRWLIIGVSVLIFVVTAVAVFQLTALTQEGLVSQLQAKGASVSVSNTLYEPFFAAPSHAVTVNGQQIVIVEYATPLHLWNDTRQISADGKTVGSSFVDWTGPAHYFKSGRILAVYIGFDTNTQQLLASVLGSQFAGE